MTTTKWAGILIAVVALAGCASPSMNTSVGACSLATTKDDCPGTFTKVADSQCKGNSCDTDVNIGWDGKACQVVVAAQTIKMAKGNTGAYLHWFLPPKSPWEFREESSLFALPIYFIDQNAPELRDQFSNRAVISSGRQVRIWNNNDNKDMKNTKYEYKLRVFKQGGGANDCIDSTDPAIQNDP